MTPGGRIGPVLAALVAAGTLASPPPAGADGAGGTVHRVVIERARFVPAALEIAPGDRVVWVNRDLVAHTATGDDGWDAGVLKRGATATAHFPVAGTYAYGCFFHPAMRGTIVVAAP